LTRRYPRFKRGEQDHPATLLGTTPKEKEGKKAKVSLERLSKPFLAEIKRRPCSDLGTGRRSASLIKETTGAGPSSICIKGKRKKFRGRATRYGLIGGYLGGRSIRDE